MCCEWCLWGSNWRGSDNGVSDDESVPKGFSDRQPVMFLSLGCYVRKLVKKGL